MHSVEITRHNNTMCVGNGSKWRHPPQRGEWLIIIMGDVFEWTKTSRDQTSQDKLLGRIIASWRLVQVVANCSGLNARLCGSMVTTNSVEWSCTCCVMIVWCHI